MKKGFTLVELLVVIAVIGIIVSICVTAVRHGSEQQYCETYGDVGFRYLPAKCIKYYLNADEKKIYLENVKE